MSESNEMIPEEASKGSSGVYVVKGGYRKVGKSIELPTVSGPSSRESQDGLEEDDFQMRLVDAEVTEDGMLTIGGESLIKSTPGKTGGWNSEIVSKEAPQADQPAVQEDVNEEASGKTALAVDVVGAAVSPRETPPTPSSDPVCIRLTHQETGLSFVMDWDLIVLHNPADAVKTLVLGKAPESGILTLPIGGYELQQLSVDNSPEWAEPLSVYFGGQSFQSTYKYYIFVVKDD